MLYHLLQNVGPPRWPGVPLRAALAAITAWAVCLAVGPGILRWLRRVNIREKTEKTPIEDEKLRRAIADKSGTPTMGGLILLAGLGAGVLLWADLSATAPLATLSCGLAMSLLGMLDDRLKLRGKEHTDRGLKVRYKLLGQGLMGAALGALFLREAGVPRFPVLAAVPAAGLLAALLWGALLVAVMANSTNVTDGMDGLLAGLAPPAALVLGAACWAAGTPAAAGRLGIPHVAGAAELAVVCAALLGACIGFLKFNHYPARVFMGDTGSMAIGGTLAAVGLAARQELVLALAGLVFLVEFGSSVLQIAGFQLFGKRVLPIAPVHHIFQKQGHSEPRIVRGFYLAGLAAAIAAVASVRL